MDNEKRYDLIVRSPTEEVVTNDELKTLLQTTTSPKHYIGLEISGILHVGSLILTGFKINDLIKANVKPIVFLADWHTYINNKLGGDWNQINQFSNYYKEAFNFFCPGVKVILGNNLYNEDSEYWKNFMKFCKHMTLARTVRSLTIMGRNEKENLDFSQFLYPAMQAADIHALDLDIAHAGMDQRKIHMLVREIFPKLGWKVPVCIHHHLLPGLAEPTPSGITENKNDDILISSKMSKSKPESSLLIHDDESILKKKITRSFCPEGIIKNNPILELVRYVVFHCNDEFTISRPSKFGGNITYYNYNDLEADYSNKKIHPLDLKQSTSYYINKIIEPIRNHFKGKEPPMDQI